MFACRNGHAHCLLCGGQNPLSLGLRFLPQRDATVRASVRARRELQGYEGMVHGGVLAALLDAAMTHCLFHKGIRAVTADLHVRYIRPVPLHVTMDVRACVVSTTPRLFVLRAEILYAHSVAAWAEAKFMKRTTTSTREKTRGASAGDPGPRNQIHNGLLPGEVRKCPPHRVLGPGILERSE